MTELTAPADVVELSKKIEKVIVFDGGVSSADDSQYLANLPEGATPELVKAMQEYDNKYISATALAFGNRSITEMKKDKTLKETQFSTNLGKDTVAGVFRREYEKPLGIPKDGEERKFEKAYGQLNMSYKKNGSAGSRGSLKKVRTDLNNEARKYLGV